MSDPGQPPPGGWAPIRPSSPGGPSGPGGQLPPPPPPPPPYQPPEGGFAPPQAPAGYPGGAVGGGTGGAGGAGGYGGSGGKAPKRIKPASTGRRAPSFALVGGLGLLGLLITIAILAVLANTVLSGTDDAADVIGGSLPPELTTTVPGQTTAPSGADGTTETTVSDGGVSGDGLPTLGESSNAAVCQVNRGTLEVAAQVYEISFGAPPVDMQQLLDSGVLSEPVPNYSVSAGPEGVVITGEGICAGM